MMMMMMILLPLKLLSLLFLLSFVNSFSIFSSVPTTRSSVSNSCQLYSSSSDGRSCNNNSRSVATAVNEYDHQRRDFIDDDVLPIISDADNADNADNNATTAITNAADIFMSSKTPLLAETLLLVNQKYKNDKSSSTSYNDISQSSISTSSSSIASIASTVAEAEAESPLLSLLSEIIITSLASYSLYGLLGNLLTQYEWVQTWRYSWPLFIGIYYCFDGAAATLLSSPISVSRILSRIVSSLSPLQQQQQQQQQQQIEEREEEEEDIITNNTGTTTTTTTITDLLLQVLKIACGIGLFVGGFADAFLPVWMTGPNFITNAGLAPDCAILLLLLNIIEVGVSYYGNIIDINDTSSSSSSSSSSGKISQQQQQIMSIIPTSATLSSTPTSLPLLLLRITLWAELYKLGESSIDEIISSIFVISQ
jgi:hypothetical protein